MSGDDVPKPFVTIEIGSVELPIEETDGAHKSRPSDEAVGTPVNLDLLTNSQGRGSANNTSPHRSDSMHHLSPAISAESELQAQDDNCGIPIESPRKQNPEASELSQRQDTKIRDEEKQLQNLMVVRSFLVQQLNSFGVGLTLLVAVTAVTILLPPDFEDLKNLRDTEAETRDGIVQYDDISTLRNVIRDNIRRVRRTRVSLILSLGLCMLAFVCGAFAILGSAKCSRYLARGTICGGGLVLAFEIGMTFVGPSRFHGGSSSLYSTVKTSQLG